MIVLFLFNEILVLTNCKCGNYYRGIYLVTSSKDKKKWNCIKISLESRYKYEELLDPNGSVHPSFIGLWTLAWDLCVGPTPTMRSRGIPRVAQTISCMSTHSKHYLLIYYHMPCPTSSAVLIKHEQLPSKRLMICF